MFISKYLKSILVVVVFSVPSLQADDCRCADGKEKKSAEVAMKDLKCPVNETSKCDGAYCSKEVSADNFAEHDGKKVYFCCNGCVKAFKKDPKPFLEKVKEQWAKIDEQKEKKE